MKPKAFEALKAYRQADEDGVMVLVSREALDEAIATIGDLYALGLIAEEMAEVIQVVGKWLRFGPDHASKAGKTARRNLPREAGDALAALEYAAADGLLRYGEMATFAMQKSRRLYDPESLDDQGNRLAPEPRGKVRGDADPSR